MRNKRLIAVIPLLVALVAAGCSSQDDATPTPLPTATPLPAPSQTSEPTATPAGVVPATPVPPATPALQVPTSGGSLPVGALIGIVAGVAAALAAGGLLYLRRSGRLFQPRREEG